MWALVGLGISVAWIAVIAYGISEYRGGNGAMGILKVIYVLAIAGFLVGTLAAGIAAFYEEPTGPASDEPYPYYGTPQMQSWQAREDAYKADLQDHSRNVMAITYPIGLLFVILGMERRSLLDVFRAGFTLGGISIIIYAITQENLSDEIRFIGVAVGLAVLIYVGYRTFLQRKPITQES